MLYVACVARYTSDANPQMQMGSVRQHIDSSSYTAVHLKGPRLKGAAVRALAYILRFSWVARRVLRATNKFDVLEGFDIPNYPTHIPRHFPNANFDPADENEHCTRVAAAVGASVPERGSTVDEKGSAFRANSIMDYHRAYLSGRTTPSKVAERLIAALKDPKAKELKAVVEYNEEVRPETGDVVRLQWCECRF